MQLSLKSKSLHFTSKGLGFVCGFLFVCFGVLLVYLVFILFLKQKCVCICPEFVCYLKIQEWPVTCPHMHYYAHQGHLFCIGVLLESYEEDSAMGSGNTLKYWENASQLDAERVICKTFKNSVWCRRYHLRTFLLAHRQWYTGKKKERWQIEAVRSEYLTATNVLAGSKFDCTATWITKVWKCHGNILDVQW